MTEPNSSPSSDATAAEPRSYARTFFRGCGCLTACAILGVAVALVGKGELASWGSGLVGVLFLVLVVGTSGTNGWFNREG